MSSFRSVIILCFALSALVSAEQLPRFLGGERVSKFNSGDVAFDYPDNWRQIALPLPTVAAFARGEELSFTINRTGVEYPQTYNEAFAEFETDTIRKNYPDATSFTSRGVTHKTLGEILQVDFIRPKGTTGRGRPLRYRVFVVPAGRSVYRIVCLGRADEFAKRHEPVFTQMMDSLVITPPAAPQAKEGSW